MIYVDRLDATASTGGELPALRVLSESLGAGLWLNTIVALTHAGVEGVGSVGQGGCSTRLGCSNAHVWEVCEGWGSPSSLSVPLKQSCTIK